MEREDILNRIDEQERWAASALSRVQEENLFPVAQRSDAEFLVRVRDRIERSRGTVVYRPQFLPLRRVAWVTSTCVILLIAVIAGGRFTRSPEEVAGERQLAATEPPTQLRLEPEAPLAEMSAMTDAFTMETGTIVDSLAAADIDPVELAQYLDVPEFVEEDVADTLEDGPLTDQLLALDDGTLEEVLNDLEDTEFF